MGYFDDRWDALGKTAEDVLNDTRELLAQCVRDRAALRAALKEALDALRAAPKPQSRYLGLIEAPRAWRENYDLWYEGQRQAALGLEEAG